MTTEGETVVGEEKGKCMDTKLFPCLWKNKILLEETWQGKVNILISREITKNNICTAKTKKTIQKKKEKLKKK